MLQKSHMEWGSKPRFKIWVLPVVTVRLWRSSQGVKYLCLPLECFPCHFPVSFFPSCAGFSVPAMSPNANIYFPCHSVCELHVICLSLQPDCQLNERATLSFLLTFVSSRYPQCPALHKKEWSVE